MREFVILCEGEEFPEENVRALENAVIAVNDHRDDRNACAKRNFDIARLEGQHLAVARNMCFGIDLHDPALFEKLH